MPKVVDSCKDCEGSLLLLLLVLHLPLQDFSALADADFVEVAPLALDEQDFVLRLPLVISLALAEL